MGDGNYPYDQATPTPVGGIDEQEDSSVNGLPDWDVTPTHRALRRPDRSDGYYGNPTKTPVPDDGIDREEDSSGSGKPDWGLLATEPTAIPTRSPLRRPSNLYSGGIPEGVSQQLQQAQDEVIGAVQGQAVVSTNNTGGITVNPLRREHAYSDQEKAVNEDSLHKKTSILGILGTGAVVGPAVNGSMYGLDYYFLSRQLNNLNPTDGTASNRLWQWWEKQSPAGQVLEQSSKSIANVETQIASAKLAERTAAQGFESLSGNLLTQAESELQTRRQLLQFLTSEGTTSLDDVLAQAKTVNNSELVKLLEAEKAGVGTQLLEKRHQFLNQVGNLESTQLLRQIGTVQEVQAGNALFALGTSQANTLEQLVKKKDALMKAQESVASTEMALRNTALTEAYGGASLGKVMSNSLAKGTLVSALSLGGGQILDSVGSQLFGYNKPILSGWHHLAIDGVVVPGILLSKNAALTPGRKAGVTAGLLGLSRASDWLNGAGYVEESRLLRPNFYNTAGITASALAPLGWKGRSALALGGIAAGWVFGDSDQSTAMRDESKLLLERDQTVHTETSFVDAANKAKELGLSNPATELALNIEISGLVDKERQELQGQLHPLDFYRQAAVLYFGRGQARLELGSRLGDLNDPNNLGKDARILPGTNYDLGSDATYDLRRAADALKLAKTYASQHKEEEFHPGRKIDDDYIKQLESLEKQVEEKLNVVYGKHDIESVYMQVKEKCHGTSIPPLLLRLEQEFKVTTTLDPGYKAKMARDLVLINMAYAEHILSSDTVGARMMLSTANAYLEQAQKLDANAADLQQLQKIADSLNRNIPGARK